MNPVTFKTQMTAEVDAHIADWSKVKQYCDEQGNMYPTLDEFSERLSCDFFKATPQQMDDGKVVRNLEIGSFIEQSDGFTHQLSKQDADLFGEITLTISKDFDSEKVEKI